MVCFVLLSVSAKVHVSLPCRDRHFRRFESLELLDKALKTAPVVEIWREARENCLAERALAHLPSTRADGASCAPAVSAAALHAALEGGASRLVFFRDSVLNRLLSFFKHRFFKWVNSKPCHVCGHGTSNAGRAEPSEEERRGAAGVVELHRCTSAACGATTRFPRYNDPLTLLDTREGRCGEWANAFCALCVGLGFDTRHVHDSTDHVWTEVWSEGQERWLHADSCEQATDTPLMYETGWNKKLQHITAIGRDEVVDVTRRYTRQLPEVLARRAEGVPEAALAAVLEGLARMQLYTCMHPPVTPAREVFVAERAASEQRELEFVSTHSSGELKPGEMQGRLSGSAEWRIGRGEMGAGLAGELPAPATEAEAVARAGAAAGAATDDTSDVGAALARMTGRAAASASPLSAQGSSAGWRRCAAVPGSRGLAAATAIAGGVAVMAVRAGPGGEPQQVVWTEPAQLLAPHASASPSGSAGEKDVWRALPVTYIRRGCESAILAASGIRSAPVPAEGAEFPEASCQVTALASTWASGGTEVFAGTADGRLFGLRLAQTAEVADSGVSGRATRGWHAALLAALPGGLAVTALEISGGALFAVTALPVRSSAAGTGGEGRAAAVQGSAVWRWGVSVSGSASLLATAASSPPTEPPSASSASSAVVGPGFDRVGSIPSPATAIACAPDGLTLAADATSLLLAVGSPLPEHDGAADGSEDLLLALGRSPLADLVLADSPPPSTSSSTSSSSVAAAASAGDDGEAAALADGAAVMRALRFCTVAAAEPGTAASDAPCLTVRHPRLQPIGYPLVFQLAIGESSSSTSASSAGAAATAAAGWVSSESAIRDALAGRSAAWIGLVRVGNEAAGAGSSWAGLRSAKIASMGAVTTQIDAVNAAEAETMACTWSREAASLVASTVTIAGDGDSGAQCRVNVALPAHRVPTAPGVYALRLHASSSASSALATLGHVCVAHPPMLAGPATVIDALGETPLSDADSTLAAVLRPQSGTGMPMPGEGSACECDVASRAVMVGRILPKDAAEAAACASSLAVDAGEAVAGASPSLTLLAGPPEDVAPLVIGALEVRAAQPAAADAEAAEPAAAAAAAASSAASGSASPGSALTCVGWSTLAEWLPFAPLPHEEASDDSEATAAAASQSQPVLLALHEGFLFIQPSGAASLFTAAPAVLLAARRAAQGARQSLPSPWALGCPDPHPAAPAAVPQASEAAAAMPPGARLRGGAAAAAPPSPADRVPAAALSPAVRATAYLRMRSTGCGSNGCTVPNCRGGDKSPKDAAAVKAARREAMLLAAAHTADICARALSKQRRAAAKATRSPAK